MSVHNNQQAEDECFLVVNAANGGKLSGGFRHSLTVNVHGSAVRCSRFRGRVRLHPWTNSLPDHGNVVSRERSQSLPLPTVLSATGREHSLPVIFRSFQQSVRFASRHDAVA